MRISLGSRLGEWNFRRVGRRHLAVLLAWIGVSSMVISGSGVALTGTRDTSTIGAYYDGGFSGTAASCGSPDSGKQANDRGAPVEFGGLLTLVGFAAATVLVMRRTP